MTYRISLQKAGISNGNRKDRTIVKDIGLRYSDWKSASNKADEMNATLGINSAQGFFVVENGQYFYVYDEV